MKTKFFLCAILALAMASHPTLVDAPAPAPLPVVVKKYPSLPAFLLKSVHRIRTESGLGSGFSVHLSEWGLAGKNYVITAAHVIINKKAGRLDRNIEVEVSLSKNKARVWALATVVSIDESNDVAVLAIDVDAEPDQLAKIAKQDNLQIGDPIAVVGCPSGTLPVVTFGYLFAKEYQIGGSSEPELLWEGSATLFPGNSGGPVYDVNTEEIIGIADAGVLSPKAGFAANVCFFVPFTAVREHIQSNLDKFGKFEPSKK